MRSMWKGAISFGLVNIPVKLFSATERKDIKFNYLHNKCKSPVQYQKFCPVCEEEVKHEDIVRGYEYEKGKYVVIDENDLENIPTTTGKSVDILDFVDLVEIDPVFYDKSYYLGPNDGGQKAYRLLKKAMEETGKIAIAKVVIRSKQTLAAIRPSQDALIMETMFFPEEIRNPQAIPELEVKADIHDNELKMAVNLISSLSSAFQPEKYTNEYRQAMLEVIESKITGQEVAIPEAPAAGKVVDLMDALKASIDLAKKEKAKADKQAKPKKARKTS